MAKIRIYELAKELNMSNKMLLEKLREMNISVKSHMSPLDEEIVFGIKNVFFRGKAGEKRTKKRVTLGQ